jgi:hypothetical protein
MGKKMLQIEAALHLWEDLCLLKNKRLSIWALEHQDIPRDMPHGPAVHAPEFRKHLLENGAKGDLDCERFVDWEEFGSDMFGDTLFLPIHLFAWNRYSRRVFHLSSELQLLLSATSLKDIRWGEIRWPFKSFVLTLDEPVEDNQGNEFDCVLVTNLSSTINAWRLKGSDILSFTLLSTRLKEYRPIDREMINKISKPRKWKDEKMQRKMLRMGNDYVKSFTIALTSLKDVPIEKPTEEIVRDAFAINGIESRQNEQDSYLSYSLIDKFKHLLASMCLFLQTLPPKKFPDNWQSAEKQQEATGEFSPAAVFTTNDIFKIECKSTLSRESQETIAAIRQSRIGREKCPHWKRGHWRRVMNYRNNPTAPKIWILPYFVNEHRLPPGSLPVGSKTTLE